MKWFYVAACTAFLTISAASAQSVFDSVVPEAEPKTRRRPSASQAIAVIAP